VRSYRTSDAEVVLVGLGSALETAEAVVDHLRDAGLAAGAATVTQFRPFPGPALLHAVRGAKDVAVLERVDDPLATANPLAREVMALLYEAERRGELRAAPRVHQALGGPGGSAAPAGARRRRASRCSAPSTGSRCAPSRSPT
jgi:pyruvate/2-oxoacid:ferredoxin oxidoreductase alpha subunit